MRGFLLQIERRRSKLPSLALDDRRRLINLRLQGGDREILGGGSGGYSDIALASDDVK